MNEMDNERISLMTTPAFIGIFHRKDVCLEILPAGIISTLNYCVPRLTAH
jgi:hypothetical protein